MYVLGLDTTQAACSAAVYCTQQQTIVGKVCEQMQRGHAEALAQIITAALAQAGITLSDIDRFAVTTGPGTFTGVRIGLSAAKGFGLALKKPVAGISSLEAIARNHREFATGNILAAFDARRSEVYVQLFSAGKQMSPPQLRGIDDLADLCGLENTQIVGTATDLLAGRYPALNISAAPKLPDAQVVARACADGPFEENLQPLYLRRADAKAQTPLIAVEARKVHLSKATREHAGVLSALHAHGFEQAWSEKVMADSLSVAGTRCQLAFDDDKKQNPVGFIMYRDAADEREILTLSVATNARRRNVAGTLLNDMINKARLNGIAKIFLEVRDDNQAAINLYKKHGFTPCGRRPGYYQSPHGEKRDGIIMTHAL